MVPVAVAGRIVPHWAEGLAVDVLAAVYQQILVVLAGPEAVGGMRVKPLAVALGRELAPSRIEGVRSRVKRLAQRGWVREARPNVFTVATGTASAVAG
ncbi:hypothetical protein [Streptomyces sp. NPDC102360]|uniref:hypothetical protein n=1 Tax=Streptomyces sp. NPDC102360 TaxID=3366160 RepID=UPI0037F57DB0